MVTTVPATVYRRKRVNPYIAGCDRRRHSKAYLTTNTRHWLEQYPLSYFLYDPPILVDDEIAWGVCDQGVSYFESGGIWHAKTIVGRGNYFNAADILMEFTNGWGSALAPLIGDGIKKLTPVESRRLIFHRGGWIDNFKKYRDEYKPLSMIQECMLPVGPDRDAHLEGKEMCASLHWQHVERGKRNPNDRYTVVEVGEMTYDAVAPIEDHPPQDKLALIAWMPIDEINIVDSPDISDKSEIDDALAFLAGQCALPVYLTDN
jgi:hypothetical protein